MEEEENWEVCDTELCLNPIGQRQSLSSSSSALTSRRRGKAQDENGNIAIFYNGRICVCDVTEIQARAIITMAKKMEINNDNKGDALERLQVPCRLDTTASSMAVVPSLLLNQSLSMKRSLQQFLQKRKTRSRLQLSSLPYQYHRSF